MSGLIAVILSLCFAYSLDKIDALEKRIQELERKNEE